MNSEIKPLYGLERVKLSDVIPIDTPFSAFVFPTTFCNFKCNYCGHSLGFEEMREKYDFIPETMNLETFDLFVKQMKTFPNKLKLLSLTGHGEPLLNPHIVEMIKIAKAADIAERIEIISNGSLLTPELSRKLIASGLDVLKISLQGLSDSKYKEVCNANIEFSRLLENIAFFHSIKGTSKIFVKIMDIALESNEENLFYEYFSNISDRMFIEQCRPVYDGVDYDHLESEESDRYGRINKKRDVCPLPFFMIGVFPNGDVEPCDTIYKPIKIGNIKDENLLDMWTGKKLRKFQLEQLERKRYDNRKCANCCAPNDVSHPEDVLDDTADVLSAKWRKCALLKGGLI